MMISIFDFNLPSDVTITDVWAWAISVNTSAVIHRAIRDLTHFLFILPTRQTSNSPFFVTKVMSVPLKIIIRSTDIDITACTKIEFIFIRNYPVENRNKLYNTLIASGVHANLYHLLIGVSTACDRNDGGGTPSHSRSHSPAFSAFAKSNLFSPMVPTGKEGFY